jgi:hypothetical protein
MTDKPATKTKTASKPVAAMLSVYDGQRCIGHLLARGRSGWESFDTEQKSLGLFSTQAAAACAVHNAVGGEIEASG